MINERIVIEEKTKDYNEAWIETYFWQESEELYPGQKRPVIVICPGGAYGMTSDREAEPIAMQYLAKGYHSVILRYSVEPARYPLALLQLAKSVAFLRENAAEFHIDTNKIVIQGFSAGGHLAASLGVFWNTALVTETLGIDAEKVRPNGLMLSYPVITSGEKAHHPSFERVLGEDYANEERRHRTQNQIAIVMPLITFALGLLVEHFFQIVGFLFAVFH